jgi:hypothetical protein
MIFFYLDYKPYFRNSYLYFANNIWHDGECISYHMWVRNNWRTVRQIKMGSYSEPEYEWLFLSEQERTLFALRWA